MTSELTERQWESAEINQYLRQLPAIIAKKSQEVIEAESLLKEQKHLIYLTEASIKAQYIGGKHTATELSGLAYSQTAELHKELLGLEKAYALAKARAEYYRDLFNSCRKAANLRIEEARRLEGTLSRREP